MVKNTTCKICRFYGKISTHVKPKHGLTILQYYDQYIALENETIGFIYVNKGYSANQIKSFVQYKTDCSISPSKKNIYEHLRENSIFIRSTSEAIEKWSCNRGGPWNKGLNKHNSDSVKKYADKRFGKDNPFYRTDPNKRIDTYYDRISIEEANRLRRKIGRIIKDKHLKGEINHPLKDSERREIVIEKIRKGWYKWAEKQTTFSHVMRSEKEDHVSDILKECGFEVIQQYKIKGLINPVDIFLPEHDIIVEFNGDYWHCNPRKYNPYFWNSPKQKYAYELWNKDIEKLLSLNNKGYSVIILWENTYKSLLTEDIKSWLKYEINKHKTNKKI